jgi:hypothetical protein
MYPWTYLYFIHTHTHIYMYIYVYIHNIYHVHNEWSEVIWIKLLTTCPHMYVGMNSCFQDIEWLAINSLFPWGENVFFQLSSYFLNSKLCHGNRCLKNKRIYRPQGSGGNIQSFIWRWIGLQYNWQISVNVEW